MPGTESSEKVGLNDTGSRAIQNKSTEQCLCMHNGSTQDGAHNIEEEGRMNHAERKTDIRSLAEALVLNRSRLRSTQGNELRMVEKHW